RGRLRPPRPDRSRGALDDGGGGLMVLARFPIRAGVPVSDLDRARAFYSDVLGLELAEEIEGEALHYRCGEGTWLEVFRTRAGVVTVSGIVEMGGHKAAWFTDPDGNVIGVFEED